MKTRQSSHLTLKSLCLALTVVVSTIAHAATTEAPGNQPTELVVTSLAGGNADDIKRVRTHAFVKASENVFGEGERRALSELGQEHVARAVKLTVDSDERARELEAWATRLGLKVKIERNAMSFAMSTNRFAATSNALGSQSLDRFFSRQWALQNTGQTERLAIDDLTSLPIKGLVGEDIGVSRAPAENNDPSRAVIVAVLDTGIDYEHADLAGQLVEKPGECRALVEYTNCLKNASADAAKTACDQKFATMDTDGNGYPLDCSGWNTTARKQLPGSGVWGDSNAVDSNGHGTHVAGIIAALADANGVRGVMRNVKILPVKVLSSSPSSPVRPSSIDNAPGTNGSDSLPSPQEKDLKAAMGFGDIVARGMLYAIRSGAQVINLSLGWPANVESNLMRQMVELARARGVLVVAAAGNDSTDALIRPCVYTGLICVASHDPDGAISNFSNYGSGVDIAAPGMNILSTYPASVLSVQFPEAVGYEIKSGTSMASPFVAGVLARLLNLGIPAREAYARIMVGARPHRDSSVRPAALARQYTLSGNIDLARAVAAGPQPLILPTDKLPVLISWDRQARSIPFSVPLKNFWAKAGPVSVEARLLARGGVRPGSSSAVLTDAVLAQALWSFDSWAADEVKNLATSLIINSDRLESDLAVEFTVRIPGLADQVRLVQAEVRVPLSRQFNDPSVTSLAINGSERVRNANLRTVTSLDDRAEQDYVAIEAAGPEWSISLVKETLGNGYNVGSAVKVPAPRGELLLLHRLDLNRDGLSDYVLIYRNPPAPNKKQPTFVFQFFDHDFKPLTMKLGGQTGAQIEYANDVSVLPETFGWMSIGGRRAPAWVYRGLTPELEKKPFDPWNPNPIDVPSYKVYYLGEDGLRTVTVPTDYTPLAALNASALDRRRGSLPVILVKGSGAEIEYATAAALNGRLEGLQSLAMNRFRAFRGTDLKEVLSLVPSRPITGTAFATDSYRGTQRVTALLEDGGVVDATVGAISGVDSISNIVAVFRGERRSGAISQTLYELQYTDFTTQQTVSTSMRRFSFLPGFFFFKFFYPAVLTDSRGGTERLPGVYMPSGLGLTPGLEVLTARYGSDNQVEAFVRPAKLRFEAVAGCEAMGNALAASASNPTQVMFYCGDRFVKVPLTY